jgi:hypothetical protein
LLNFSGYFWFVVVIYEWGGLFASVSWQVWNAYGDLVGAIRAASGFLGSGKGGAISCLAFHSLELKLAAGGDTSVIALYTIDATAGRLSH